MDHTVNRGLLLSLEPHAKHAVIDTVAPAMATWLPQYGIDTPLRLAHFLAQAAWESDHFTTLVEYASGAAYEGRKDLGNVQAGDGRRYKGRGIFQLTGRANYEAYGRVLGVDLVNNPDHAADAEISVRVACEYWKRKGLNALADADDVKGVTRKINGGYNGLPGREALLATAKRLVQGAPAAPAEAPAHDEVPDIPIAPDAPEPDHHDPQVEFVQKRLRELGYYIVGAADGDPARQTQAAILMFRNENGLPLSNEIDDQLLAALASALPRAMPGRAAQPVSEIAPKLEPMRQTAAARLWAKIAAIPTLIWGGIMGIADHSDEVTEKLRPLFDVTASVPLWVYFLAIGGVVLLVLNKAGKAETATVDLYREGRIM